MPREHRVVRADADGVEVGVFRPGAIPGVLRGAIDGGSLDKLERLLPSVRVDLRRNDRPHGSRAGPFLVENTGGFLDFAGIRIPVDIGAELGGDGAQDGRKIFLDG